MEGKSDLKIAKGLEHDGILAGAGKATWWASTGTPLHYGHLLAKK